MKELSKFRASTVYKGQSSYRLHCVLDFVEYRLSNMSTFALLLLCVQACLVQNVYSQWCGAGPALAPAMIGEPFGYGYGMGLAAPGAYAPGAFGLAAPGLAPYALPSAAGAYGGEGIGDLTIFGEMPVGGTTVIGGQVPILGAVEFGGPVPAAGAVTIAGSCGCRANRAYLC